MQEKIDRTFVPLHVHSMYSRLIGGDGFCFPRELAQRAHDIGCPAIALTDHGTMAGTAEFYRDCQKIGIKPIMGIEAYITPMGHSCEERIVYDVKSLRGKPGYTRSNYHLIVLAKDEVGWRNMTELSKQSFARGYYYKPRIDHDFLLEHHEGLIISSACILGETANLAWCEDYKRMREVAQWYQDLLGEDYYLEVMYHGLDMERKALEPIRDLAKELGIKVIATNDSHYALKKEYKLHKALMLDKMHKSFADKDVAGSFFGDDDDTQQQGIEEEGGDSNPIFETSSELYIKDFDEMVAALAIEGATPDDVARELATTLEIADKCNYELPIIDPSDPSQYYVPVYPVEKDLQYQEFEASGFEIKQSTIDAIVAEMHKGGQEGDCLEDFLNEHELLSLRFLMWMCDKGLRENVLPKLKEKGEALPMEYWCENPPDGFEIKHTHNSPDELWIREQMANGLSVDDMIKVYQDRIDYEVSVVVRKRFIDYFSVVQNYANFTKLNGSVMGPGRGSGGGSLLLYLLSITSIDPIPNKLLFFRFLNPERNSVPDVDLDFSATFRDNVLKPYLKSFYGEEYCASVATYMYYWGKAAIKAAARILFPMPDSVQIGVALTDMLDDKPKLDLNKELDGSNPAFAELVNSRIEYKQTVELAKMIQGRLSGESIHASAYIVSPKKLTDLVPLGVTKDERARAQREGVPISDTLIAWDGTVCGDVVGLVKLDLLCVVDLEMMELTCKTIKRIYGCDINLERIPLDDASVWSMLNEHLVAGIFQLDGSEGMAQVMDQVHPESIENINAIVALYRPGPMDYIPNYVDGKNHPEHVKYLDERLEPILKDTYGVCCFQEQSMQITQVIGGFSGGQADHYRKCLSKDTLMWTQDGPYSIEEIAEMRKEGTPVKLHTMDENECLTRFNVVRHVPYKGEKQLVKVVLGDGSSITCTPDHRILTEAGWIEAQSLEGHYVYKDIAPRYGTASESTECLFLMVAMITEGYMPETNRPWFFCNQDRREIEQFISSYETVFGETPKCYDPDDHDVIKVMVSRENMLSLGLLPGKSDKKILPMRMLRLDKPCRDFVVGKMLDFDGYVSHNVDSKGFSQYNIGYASKNRALCEQMLMIFNCMGVQAHIHAKYNKEYDAYYYAVDITNSRDVMKLAQVLHPYSYKVQAIMSVLEQEKDSDALSGKSLTSHSYAVPNAYWYPRIMALIEQSGYTKHELFGKNIPRQDNSERASLAVLRRFLAGAGRNKQLERLSADDREVYFEAVASVEDAGMGETYDFTMNSGCLPQAFANGILVHNCSAKKHMDQLLLLKDDFLNGALANHTDPAVAEELWAQLVKFGSYAFNRCITGDTLLHRTAACPRDKEYPGMDIPVEEVYRRFNASAARNSPDQPIRSEYRSPNPARGLFISCRDADGRARRHKVKNVYQQGEQDVYLVTLENGKHVKATGNHRFQVADGSYKTVSDLVVGQDELWCCDFVYDDAKTQLSRIVSIEPAGREMTYDVEIESEEHNFFANGICSHNSHSAAYALIAYRGAFLKAHFPECFFASLCTLKPKAKKTNKVPEYLNEARQMGVTVKPPHVNYSEADFDVPERGVIAFGLGGIAGVGAAAKVIVEERHKNGEFKDFSDFMTRVPREVGKGALLPLMQYGALDGLGWSRKAMVESIDQIIEFRKSYFASKAKQASLAMDLFSIGAAEDAPADDIMLTPPFDTEYNERQMLEMEKKNLGIYLSGSPEDYRKLSRYATEREMGRMWKEGRKAAIEKAKGSGAATMPPRPVHVADIADLPDKTLVDLLCIISDPISKTKPNPRMFKSGKGCSINVQDWGVLEESRFGFSPRLYKTRLTMFSRVMAETPLPRPGDLVRVIGKVNVDPKGEWPNAVIVDKLEFIQEDSRILSTMTRDALVELQQIVSRMANRLGDPESDAYMIPALTFPTQTDKEQFLASPLTQGFMGTGHVLIAVADGNSSPETVSLRQTVGMVNHAKKFGAMVQKVRLPKAQSAIERRKLMLAGSA